jgi:hypothetical protein
MSAFGTKRTFLIASAMSAFDAVDGARSGASKCCRLPESSRAIQGGETGNDGGVEVEGIGEDRRGNADKVDPGIGTTRVGQRIFECVLLIGTRSAQSIMASGFTAAQTGRTHDPKRASSLRICCDAQHSANVLVVPAHLGSRLNAQSSLRGVCNHWRPS